MTYVLTVGPTHGFVFATGSLESLFKYVKNLIKKNAVNNDLLAYFYNTYNIVTCTDNGNVKPKIIGMANSHQGYRYYNHNENEWRKMFKEFKGCNEVFKDVNNKNKISGTPEHR